MTMQSSAGSMAHAVAPLRHNVLIAALLLLMPLVLYAAPARADTAAEQFVSTNIQKGFNILNDASLSDAQKRSEFRDFLLSLTDMRRIGLFTLGPARRSATPAQIDTFVDAFRDFAVAIYQSRLSAFSGQTLKVTGSTQHGPHDVIVATELAGPNTGSRQQPLQVDFRVSKKDGKFTIIDVSVAGIWLAIEERDQFASFLNDHGNSVPVLTRHLQQLTAKLHSGGGNQGG